jgi:hypothetical protein
VTVTVQPIYKTYTYVDGATEPVVTTETAAAVTMPGSYYAGQKVTADTRDYNKLEFVTVTDDQGNQTQQRAYTYDPADADGTAGATITVTASGENRITLVYQKVVDTRTPASVVIRNHYYLLTLTSDEFGTVVKMPTQWSNTGAIYSGYFLGDTFTTTGKGSDNGYDVDTRAGIRQPAATITVDRQVTYVDFYWYKEADRTTPATVRVIHHYEIQDANPNGVSRSWTVGEDDAPLTGYYAGYVYLASPDYQGNAFSEENIVSVSPAGALTTGTALQAGSNEIHIYYVQKVDTRAATSITVIHRYFHDADALSQGSVEAVYEENISAMEADAYTAQLRSENGGVVYGYDSAEPALTIVADANADKNVIVLNYVRAEAVYTVNHTYYLNGRLQGTVSETFGGKAGDVITGASIEKRTGFGGNTYAYTGCAPDSITLRADGENVMTLRYDRTVSGNNGGGSSQTPPATTVDPDVPLEELPDGDVPLGELPDVDEPLEELPDEDVPLGELPDVDEPLEELPDEDTPLASVPRTGDRTLAWTMAAAVSGLGLVFLAVSGRKRREEP